ncbi:UPF0158 family protein [Thalassotalea piscium]
MQVNLDDIELAIEFTSSDFSDNHAYVNSETGEIFYAGDCVEEELPGDIDDNKYILIPSRRDLNLGRRVAIDFAANVMPSELDNVYSMFRSRGAYSRFRSLLEHLDLIDKWHAFENETMRQAVIDWCKSKSVPYETSI